ncbi:hypothetical protein HYQ46_010778 [Verticillium longisporum]|nr:hypothetical protein HYQ46_010778 [Verticillium longisporum]
MPPWVSTFSFAVNHPPQIRQEEEYLSLPDKPGTRSGSLRVPVASIVEKLGHGRICAVWCLRRLDSLALRNVMAVVSAVGRGHH